MGALRRNFNAGHDRRRWMDRAVFGRGANESVLRGGGAPATLDVNWATDKAYLRGVLTPITSLFTVATSGSAPSYYTNANGTLTLFGTNTVRYGTNGLLTETPRTQALIRSNEFDNAGAWANGGGAVLTANFAAAPDGTSTAMKMATGTGIAGNVNQTPATSAAGIYTASVYIKAGSNVPYAHLFVQSNSVNRGAWFNLSTGVVGTVANVTATMQSLANGWFRCTITSSANTVANEAQCIIQPARADNDLNWAAADGSQFMLIWGAQLELGRHASSYMPTTTVVAVRQLEKLLLSDTSFLNRYEGTVFSYFNRSISTGAGVHACLCGFHQGLDNKFGLSETGTAFAGNPNGPTTANAFTPGIPQRGAFAWNIGSADVVLNNGTVATAAYDAEETFNQLAVGTPSDNNQFQLDGYTMRFAYWNTKVPGTALGAIGAPDWVLTAENQFADLDYDFVMNRVNTLGTITTATAILSCTRASAGYAVNTAGVLIPFAANIPRLTNKGLLIERAATNYCLASNSIDFGTGNWALYGPPGGGTTTPNFATAPDGTQTATLLSVEIGNGIYNTVGGLTQLTAYRYSMFFKVASGPGLLYNWNGVNNTDITSGTPYANGWYRLEGELTTGAGETSAQALFTIIHPDFAQSDLYIWGAQFEAKDISTTPASSLITTTTTAVTRPVDHVGVTVDGQQVGTWYVSGNFVINVTGLNSRLLSAGVSILYTDTTGSIIGQFPPNITTSLGSGDARNIKAAAAFRPGARSICANAGTVGTDTNTADTMNGLLLFGQSGGDNDVINGYITRVSRFGNIKLADATLQSLTTL